MPNYFATQYELTQIANKIREKGGTTATLVFPQGFIAAIAALNTNGGSLSLQSKTNINPTTASQTIIADDGYDGLSSVQINAMPNGSAAGPSTISGSSANLSASNNTLTLTKTIAVSPVVTAGYVSTGTSTNAEVTLTATVTTKAAATITPSTTTQTISSGTYLTGNQTISGDVNLVAANIKSGTTIFGVTGSYSSTSASLQSKTNINPSTSSQTITPDDGYDGLSSVQINAMPSLTLPTTTASSASSGYTLKATVSRSTSDQYINIPVGYNTAGAYYKISAVANGSAAGPFSVSGTSATLSTGTNTLTLTKSITITPVVTAGYISAGTDTNASVQLTASVTTKAAATITPTTANQTISSGTYLTGTQTISGDANLVGSNIISGKSIFGVTGSVVINKYYTGSSTPSSTLGSNGDIYLQA